MKTLSLVLKKKWYDMIDSGEKTEEYREIKPYWEKRLLDYNGIIRDYHALRFRQHLTGQAFDACEEYPRGYDKVTFYLGYSKNRPSMTFKVKEIVFANGNPEWGAEAGILYFVIRLGERL